MKTLATLKQIVPAKLFKTVAFTLGASLAATAAVAQGEKANDADMPENELKVYIDDLLGQPTTGSFENARDDLLHNAIYDASDRIDWIGNANIEYNEQPDENERNYLKVDVVDWERSPANFYEFRATASYVDSDGNTIDLGSFSGIKSGITVTTTRDIGDHFADAAEDAFTDALNKLGEELGRS